MLSVWIVGTVLPNHGHGYEEKLASIRVSCPPGCPHSCVWCAGWEQLHPLGWARGAGSRGSEEDAVEQR